MKFLLIKSHIKEYQKTGKDGKTFIVKQHDDSRRSGSGGSALDDVTSLKPKQGPKDWKQVKAEAEAAQAPKNPGFVSNGKGGIILDGWKPGYNANYKGDAQPSEPSGFKKPYHFEHGLMPQNEDAASRFKEYEEKQAQEQKKKLAKIKALNGLPGVDVHKSSGKFEEPKDWKGIGKTKPNLVEPPFEALATSSENTARDEAEKKAAQEKFGDKFDDKKWKPMKGWSKAASAGALVVEDDGRVWVVEPKNHFGGYEHTYAKGRVEDGMSAQETAIKEAKEESGLEIQILGHLGDYDGSTTSTRYYIAKRIGGDPSTFHDETHAAKLVPQEHLGKFMNQDRDQRIAKDFAAKYADALKAGNGNLEAGLAKLPMWKPESKPEKTSGSGSKGSDAGGHGASTKGTGGTAKAGKGSGLQQVAESKASPEVKGARPGHTPSLLDKLRNLSLFKSQASEFDPPATRSQDRKLHAIIVFQGLKISVENRMGSIRSWYDPLKRESGHTRMKIRYGYIQRTQGADGDQVDVFIGPDHVAPMVYVIRQLHPETGAFDEDKVMLGFSDQGEAEQAYLQHYDDHRFFGGTLPMSMGEFKEALKTKGRIEAMAHGIF